MRDAAHESASRTAGIVAFCRGIARFLPADAQLVLDPIGVRFGGMGAQRLERAMDRAPSVARRVIEAIEPFGSVLWMQLRTKAIDDALLAFAQAGGRQVLILGAGFDCRAARLCRQLSGVTCYEVDHPSTQARKKRVIHAANVDSAPVHYVAWDFERDPLAELPSRLASLGHDREAPTLTIWEGVTMYLTEPAIDASLAAVHALSGVGSRLVFTYIERRGLKRERLLARFVSTLGEPWTFGWDPERLAEFLEARGYSLASDESMRDLARRMLPARYHRMLDDGTRHVAIAHTDARP